MAYFFFRQSSTPCLDFSGKILLQKKHKLARSPTGNGGIFRSLLENRIIHDMKTRGILGIHVFGVDNGLLKTLDPIFIGYTEMAGCEIGNYCALKEDPAESVGLMCQRIPKNLSKPLCCCVIEYAEIAEHTRRMRAGPEPDSPLLFSAASICNHYFKLSVVERFLDERSDHTLPPHAAVKKIPYISIDTGHEIYPETPNGIKIEQFIFDSFPVSVCVAGLKSSREKHFAPVKNSEGRDSPATCRKMMSDLHKSWIEAAGGILIGTGLLEISPLVSYAGENLEPYRDVEITLPLYLSKELHLQFVASSQACSQFKKRA